jgi:hypothetical protein
MGAGFMMAAGALAMACGDDTTGGGGLPGSPDATSDRTTGDGPNRSDVVNPNPDGGDLDAGVDCGRIPQVREAGPGPYCPFQQNPDGSSLFANCGANQTCCAPTFVGGGTPPSTCATGNANNCVYNDAGGLSWECAGSAHCNGGQVCCMIPRSLDAGADADTKVIPDNNCPTGELRRALNAGGTRCKASCTPQEVQICAIGDTCATGTCKAFPTNSRDLGACLP